MSDDLKPCPFCGGEPFSFEDYGHSTAWEVGCSNSQCRVEPHVWEKTKDEAIASWNTRTPNTSAEALTAENKRLGQQCEGLMQAGMNNGQALILAEAKLAKAMEAVSLTVRADNLRETYHALPNDHNRIGDKRSRKGRAREAWLRAFRKAAKTSRATLAEIEGEKK
jgi:Lar family restriction alleviation protein